MSSSRVLDARGKWWPAAVISALIAVMMLPFLLTPPMGNDAIFVMYVARRPSLGAVWSASRSGVDQIPPLEASIRHISMSVLGVHDWSFILPSVFWSMLAGAFLFRFVSRRLGTWNALAAVIFMLLICGIEAAVTPRGYGIMMMTVAVALDAWDYLADHPLSRLHLGLWTGALIMSVYAHYYGALIVIAFGCAVLVQAILEHRLPVLKLALLVVVGVACLPLIPYAHAATQYRSNWWSPVTLTTGLAFYSDLLRPALPALVIAAVLMTVSLGNEVSAHEDAAPEGFPLQTRIALGSLALQPLVLFVMAKLYTRAFVPRYIYGAGIALCILAVAAAARVNMSGQRRLMIMVAIPAFFLAIDFGREYRWLRSGAASHAEFLAQLEVLHSRFNGPVVLQDDGLAIEIGYKYPADAANTYFVYESLPDHVTATELAVKKLRTIAPLPVISFDEVRAKSSHFAYVGPWDGQFLERSRRDKATLQLHSGAPGGLDYWDVQFGAPAGP